MVCCLETAHIPHKETEQIETMNIPFFSWNSNRQSPGAAVHRMNCLGGCRNACLSFAVMPKNASSFNFLVWYDHFPQDRFYPNDFQANSIPWNAMVMKEFLCQLCVPIMSYDCISDMKLDVNMLQNSFVVWLEQMAGKLLKISPTFVDLPGALTQYLQQHKNLSCLSTTDNAFVLSNILQASKGNKPIDVIQFVLAVKKPLFGPWLYYFLRRRPVGAVSIPLSLHDSYPASFNRKVRRNLLLLKEAKRIGWPMDEETPIQDNTKVKIFDCQEPARGFVEMKSKFTVMARFLFWFLHNSKVDAWSCFKLAFQTEYYLQRFFRIKGLNQLESEFDWLLAWVYQNDLTCFGLPNTIFHVDILTCMKAALRAEAVPAQDHARFVYQTSNLSLLVPSIFENKDPTIDLSDKFSLLVLGMELQTKRSVIDLHLFVKAFLEAEYKGLSTEQVELKVDKFVFGIVLVLGITTISLLQQQIDQLVLCTKQSCVISADTTNVIVNILASNQPSCYVLSEDMNTSNVDEHGHPLLHCKARASLSMVTVDDQSKDNSLSTTESVLNQCKVFPQDQATYAVHTGIGHKDVAVLTNPPSTLKKAMRGRTKACNSTNFFYKPTVAKVGKKHIFVPGKFSFMHTNEPHLFHFLCDSIAKKSTNKSNVICAAWSHEMIGILSKLGITTLLELCHDLCCVPSATMVSNGFDDANRKAALLAFWKVKDCFMINLTFFTNPKIFDWQDPFDNEYPLDDDWSYDDYEQDECVCEAGHETVPHDVPLCVCVHNQNQNNTNLL